MEVLKQYVPVDIYGRCGNLSFADGFDGFFDLALKYKFYLAFENSLCREYVTEKFWRTIRLPLVPVVMGGTDYKLIAPPHSYIDVNDYPSIQALADYLNYLNDNDVYNLIIFRSWISIIMFRKST